MISWVWLDVWLLGCHYQKTWLGLAAWVPGFLLGAKSWACLVDTWLLACLAFGGLLGWLFVVMNLASSELPRAASSCLELPNN